MGCLIGDDFVFIKPYPRLMVGVLKDLQGYGVFKNYPRRCSLAALIVFKKCSIIINV